jgi:hypothetical protein
VFEVASPFGGGAKKKAASKAHCPILHEIREFALQPPGARNALSPNQSISTKSEHAFLKSI